MVEGGDLHPQRAQPTVREAGEAERFQLGSPTLGVRKHRAPPQHAVPEIEGALVLDHGARLDVQAYAVHDDGQRQPVRRVDQVDDRHLPDVPLLEGASGTEASIADGEQGLERVRLFGVEAGLADLPLGGAEFIAQSGRSPFVGIRH